MTGRVSARSAVTRPPTRWGRWLERLLLVFPVVVGAGVVAVLADAPVPAVRWTVLSGVALAALCIRLGIPVFLFLDARALNRSAVTWEPNRWLYAGAALFVSAPLVALVYLYRRFKHVPPATGAGPWAARWWTAVALAAVLGPLAFVVGLVGTVAAVGTVLAVATTVAAGLLPVGIYRDASYVRAADTSWNPNPAWYLALAFLSLLVVVLQPVLAAWYLGTRYGTFRAVRAGSRPDRL